MNVHLKRLLIAAGIVAGIGAAAEARWVPGGGYDAISIDRAARQDRAERALRDMPHQTWCSKCSGAIGNGGRKNKAPDFNGSDDGNRSGSDAGEAGRDSGGD